MVIAFVGELIVVGSISPWMSGNKRYKVPQDCAISFA